MRESLDADSRHASVLLLPHWSGALVTRTETGGETTTHGKRRLSEKHIIKKNRLSTPYWIRLIRFRDPVHGVHVARRISLAGTRFRRNPHEPKILCRAACLFSTRKKSPPPSLYDNVSIPTWRDDRRRQNHHRPSRTALAQVRLGWSGITLSTNESRKEMSTFS